MSLPTHDLNYLELLDDRTPVTVYGVVNSVRHRATRAGERLTFVGLEDLTDAVTAVVFDRVLCASEKICEVGRVLVVDGRVDHSPLDGETRLLALKVTTFEVLAERWRAMLDGEGEAA